MRRYLFEYEVDGARRLRPVPSRPPARGTTNPNPDSGELMSIDKSTVARATCDACGHREYADDDGTFRAGLELTVIECATGTPHEVYICRIAHANKAIRRVILNSRSDDEETTETQTDTEVDTEANT